MVQLCNNTVLICLWFRTLTQSILYVSISSPSLRIAYSVIQRTTDFMASCSVHNPQVHQAL